MTRRDAFWAAALLLLALLFPVGWAVAIDWIQYDERAVGENSPLYEDVVNRPAKQIYALYTSEHNEDGTHKPAIFPTPQPTPTPTDLSPYMVRSIYDGDADTRADTAETLTDGTSISSAAAVRSHLDNSAAHFLINDSATATGSVWSSQKTSDALSAVGGTEEYVLYESGNGDVAYGTFPASGFFTANDEFSIWAVLITYALNTAESFYQHVETAYSLNIVNFGKTADNRLQITIGANTYTSGVVFDDTTKFVPIEVGVSCSKTLLQCWFFVGGRAEAAQAAAFTFPPIATEKHTIGAGFGGDIFYLSVSRGLIVDPSSRHTPLREGVSQCPQCLAHYDFDAGSGATLTEQARIFRGGANYDLTVTGTWSPYSQGY